LRLILSLTIAAPLVLLAACGDEPEPAADDARSATGEVLEGTISDAMLPLATVRSQPPLAAPEAGEGSDAPEPGPSTPLQPFNEAPSPSTEPSPAAEPAAPAAAPEEPAPPEG